MHGYIDETGGQDSVTYLLTTKLYSSGTNILKLNFPPCQYPASGVTVSENSWSAFGSGKSTSQVDGSVFSNSSTSADKISASLSLWFYTKQISQTKPAFLFWMIERKTSHYSYLLTYKIYAIVHSTKPHHPS